MAFIAILATLVLISLLGSIVFTRRLHARQRSVVGDRPNGDLAKSLIAQGVKREVSCCVVEILRGYHAADVVPHPDDSLWDFMRIDAEELEFITGDALRRLRLPLSDNDLDAAPVTVADFAMWLDRHHRALAKQSMPA